MNRCKCSQLAHDFFGCCNDGRGNEFAAYTAEIVNPLKARIKELESALERQAKEGEIRGLEACKELCGVDMDLPIGSFVQEFEIDAEIARRRGETNG